MKPLSKKICLRPWEFMEIQDDWRVFNCCPTWTREYEYGVIDGKLDVEAIWNGQRAQEFRRSMLDGSFEYCDHAVCPMIQSGSLPDRAAVAAGDFGATAKAILDGNSLSSPAPTFINLSCDKSCNLQCPSCREGLIFLNERVDSAEFRRKRALLEQVLELLYATKTATTINVTGSGDPFASTLFLDFITRIDGANNPNLHLQLQTNGVLFTPENWAKLHKMHGNPISAIISLDAGTADTYAVTRRGGDWGRLMKNLDFVDTLYRTRQLRWVRLDFVCQRLNYREMPLFVDIARRHGFFCYFSRILEWGGGAYHDQVFEDQDVSSPTHPEHREFLKVINQDFGYDRIDFGNLSEFRTPLRVLFGRASRFVPHRSAPVHSLKWVGRGE